MLRLRALATAFSIAVAFGAAHSVRTKAAYIGSRASRESDQRRMRRLTGAADGFYQSETDKFTFVGPVEGVGFVNHSHHVVFRPDALGLDAWTEMLSQAHCESLADVRCTRAGGSNTAPTEDNLSDLMSSRCRPGVVLHLQGLAAEPTAQLAALFRQQLAHSRVLYVGLDALDALPEDSQGDACRAALLAGDVSPVFSIESIEAAADGSSLTLRLPRAGLFDAFLAARWHHHVEQDVGKALAKRGLSLTDFDPLLPSDAVSHARALAKFQLISLGANWEGDGAAGSVKQEHLPLVSLAGGAVQLTCARCYAYLQVDLEVNVGFCAHKRIKLWFITLDPTIDFGCQGDDTAIDGVSFHFLARLTAEAGAGLGLRLGAMNKTNGTELSWDEQTPRTRLLATPLRSLSFAIFGLPVVIKLGFGLDYRAGVVGTLEAALEAGASASARYMIQYKFDSRAEDNGVSQQWEANAEVRPPSWTVTSASGTAHVELLPTAIVSLYGIFPINASLGLRLQADLDMVTDDAVLCDVPYCGAGRDGFPLYLTWQPRLIVANGDLRVKDIVGLIPGLGGVIKNLISGDMRIIKEDERVNKPLTARKKLLGVCLPVPRRWELAPQLFWGVSGGSSAKAAGNSSTSNDGVAGRRLQLSAAPSAAATPTRSASLNASATQSPSSSATSTRSMSLTASSTQSASVTRSATPTASLPYPNLNMPAYYGDGSIASTVSFNIAPGSDVTYMVRVVDSRLPFRLQLGINSICCFSVLACFDGPYRFDLSIRFFVDPPASGAQEAGWQMTPFGYSSAAFDFDVRNGSSNGLAEMAWQAKQAQGFGGAGSWYYVRIGNPSSSCKSATGSVGAGYLLLPSATPSPTPSRSGSPSFTPTSTVSGSGTSSGSNTASGTASATASLSQGALQSVTGTGTLSATATSTGSVTASSTASVSNDPTATRSGSSTASGTATASSTTPPFAMPSCDRSIKLPTPRPPKQPFNLVSYLRAQVSSQISVKLGPLAASKVESVTEKLPQAVQNAAAAMLGADPASFATSLVDKAAAWVGGPSTSPVAASALRRLQVTADSSSSAGSDTVAVGLTFQLEALHNTTLRSANATDMEPADALDLEDAAYFASLAANSTAALLTAAVNGSLPDEYRPAVDCGSITDPQTLQLLCSRPTAGGGRRVQASGIVSLSFTDVLAASLAQQGMPAADAQSVASGSTFAATQPVVSATMQPVAITSSSGAVVASFGSSSDQGGSNDAPAGLSSGVVAGIAVGASALLALVSIGIALLIRRQRRVPRSQLAGRPAGGSDDASARRASSSAPAEVRSPPGRASQAAGTASLASTSRSALPESVNPMHRDTPHGTGSSLSRHSAAATNITSFIADDGDSSAAVSLEGDHGSAAPSTAQAAKASRRSVADGRYAAGQARAAMGAVRVRVHSAGGARSASGRARDLQPASAAMPAAASEAAADAAAPDAAANSPSLDSDVAPSLE